MVEPKPSDYLDKITIRHITWYNLFHNGITYEMEFYLCDECGPTIVVDQIDDSMPTTLSSEYTYHTMDEVNNELEKYSLTQDALIVHTRESDHNQNILELTETVVFVNSGGIAILLPKILGQVEN